MEIHVSVILHENFDTGSPNFLHTQIFINNKKILKVEQIISFS